MSELSPGKTLREWRKQQKIILGELSSSLGTTAAFVSDLERGIKGLRERHSVADGLLTLGVPTEIVDALMEVGDCQHLETVQRPISVQMTDGRRRDAAGVFCALCGKLLREAS